RIFNLSGSYYEGNNGTDGGEGGIFASYNNLIANNTIYDSKITGPHGIQFAITASNCFFQTILHIQISFVPMK
ncbi:MAG: hypothetical protein IIW88_01235, partial [Clostridia bacterium]|nr:hypothetical protein [Clostridia bacterium]